MRLSEAWQGLPLIIRALATGLLVFATGLLPWRFLIPANLGVAPWFPWAVPLMGVYLWLWWRYLGGWGWPRSTGEERRRDLCAGRPPRRVWLWSLAAGGAGAVALRAVTDAARRLSPRPEEDLLPQEILTRDPAVTALFLILMTAVVSGVVEEAAFRGYMQSPLERRHGPWMAVLLVGTFICLAQYPAGASGEIVPWLIRVPVYFAGTVVFGILASLSGSILPGMVWHIVFNVVGLLSYRRWGIPRSVWEAGFDDSFRARCAVALVFGAVSLWAFRRLAVAAAAAERTA
jgi:membrane protease YdiL (CAAX protease family)